MLPLNQFKKLDVRPLLRSGAEPFSEIRPSMAERAQPWIGRSGRNPRPRARRAPAARR